jgi:hypothetical protein
MPLTRSFLLHEAGTGRAISSKKYKKLPRRLLADLEKEGREIDFQGSFILQGSTVLAAYNDDRGLLHHPEDVREAGVFADSKAAFCLAVLGTALWLAGPVWAVDWRSGRPLDPSRVCFLFPALLFWVGLERLNAERLNRDLRPLLNSLDACAGREAGAPDWAAGRSLILLALGLACLLFIHGW